MVRFAVALGLLLLAAHFDDGVSHASLSGLGIVRQYTRSLDRRGLAKGTIDRRRLVLERFSEWLEPRPLIAASTADVETFLDQRRRLSSRTRYGWISHLHCFYEWAIIEELTDTDPTGRIDRPKLRQLLPRPISEADLAMAIEAADRTMRAWLYLAAYGGLRCAEISRLDGPDVNDAEMSLRVLGKGDKERTVPMHPRVLLALRDVGVPRSGPVFRRPGGSRIPPAMVSREGSLYLASLGITATMHQLRHRFGTRALEATGDLRAVQELLGHASPTTTAIYTKVTSKRLRFVVESLDKEGEPWQPTLI